MQNINLEIKKYFEEISVKLSNIVDYINENDVVPIVDQIEYFQGSKNKNIMIYSPIRINTWRNKYEDYSKIQYYRIKPVIDLFFCPSNDIKNIEYIFRERNNLKYENTIAVNLDNRDININDYTFCNFYNKILSILVENEDSTIMIYTQQSIVVDFLTRYNIRTPRMIIIDVFSDVENTLSILLFMSKCKYVITYSGILPLWMMYYRNGCDNIYQHLNNEWICNILV